MKPLLNAEASQNRPATLSDVLVWDVTFFFLMPTALPLESLAIQIQQLAIS
jgi:hypothetical protein